MLTRAGRAADYVEIGLGGDVCYNPLHNDLDPYAVAYAIATLSTTCSASRRSRSGSRRTRTCSSSSSCLRRLADGYTTFSEVYRYILDGRPDRRRDHEAEGRAERAAGSRRRAARRTTSCRIWRPRRWRDWFSEGPDHMAHPYSADLEALPARPQDSRTRFAARRGPRGWIASTSSKPSSDGSRTAGRRSTTACVRRSPKASSCSSRCSTTTRPSTGRSVRREAPTPVRRNRASRSRCLRSRNSSNRARCSR